MPLPTWGELNKNQTDPETIAEAIDRVIQEHDDDPDAHLDPGQAMTTHRAQTILDHPAGSVLADKNSMTEDISSSSFESLDNWTKVGSVTGDGWPGVKLYIESGAVAFSRMYSEPQHPHGWFDWTKDMLLQTTLWFDMSTNYKAYFVIGAFYSDTSISGFGFSFINGVTRAIIEGASTLVASDPIANDETAYHVYRAQYMKLDSKVHYFIDGVEVASLSKPIGVDPFSPFLEYRIATNGMIDGNMHVKQVDLSREI